jgi:hypothetical protein
MYLFLMRKFFVFLIIVVFVGGHSLSDVAAHLPGNTGNADTSAISNSVDMAFFGVTATASTGAATKDCDSKDEPVNTSHSLHCATYCGLMAAQYVGVYPEIKPDLYTQSFLSNSPSTISDHFRPPIV